YVILQHYVIDAARRGDLRDSDGEWNEQGGEPEGRATRPPPAGVAGAGGGGQPGVERPARPRVHGEEPPADGGEARRDRRQRGDERERDGGCEEQGSEDQGGAGAEAVGDPAREGGGGDPHHVRPIGQRDG